MKHFTVIFLVLLLLAGCGKREENGAGPDYELPLVEETQGYYATVHRYDKDLSLRTVEQVENGFLLTAKSEASKQHHSLRLGDDCTLLSEEDTAGAADTGLSNSVLPNAEAGGKRYSIQMAPDGVGLSRYQATVNGEPLENLPPMESGALLVPVGVLKIREEAFFVIEAVRELQMDLTERLGYYLSSADGKLEILCKLPIPGAPGHASPLGEWCWFTCGSGLYSTDGTQCRYHLDLEKLGVNMTLPFELLPLEDGRFLVLQSYQLLEICPGTAPEVPQENTIVCVGLYDCTGFYFGVFAEVFARQDGTITLQVKEFGSRESLNLAILSGELDLVACGDPWDLLEYGRRGIVAPIEGLERNVLPNILDAGSLNGQTFAVPLLFELEGMLMPASLQNPEGGFETLDQFMDAVEQLENHDFFWKADREMALYQLKRLGWAPWLNAEAGICAFSDTSFVQVLELLSRYAADWAEVQARGGVNGSRKGLLRLDGCIDSFGDACDLALAYEEKGQGAPWTIHGMEGALFPWPESGYSGLAINAPFFLGIPVNGNAEAANTVVRILLSDAVQFATLDWQSPAGMSVTENGFTEGKRRWLEKQYRGIAEGTTPYPAEFFETYSALTETLARGADHFGGGGTAVSDIISEEVQALFAGDCTAEQCAERIQNRVSIYMAEQG